MVKASGDHAERNCTICFVAERGRWVEVILHSHQVSSQPNVRVFGSTQARGGDTQTPQLSNHAN